MIPVRIKSTGVYAPGLPIGNQELKNLAKIDFDTAKTESKIGIVQRHIAHLRGINETAADFATKAGVEAIANAGLAASDIGLFIVATDTPEYISPSTAIVVQGRIPKGEVWGGAFDINAACASFSIAFDTASRILANNSLIRFALVIGVYNMPAFFRPGDAFGYSIFADGAGAFVLERVEGTESSSGYIGGQQLTDGTQWNYIGIYSGAARKPITHQMLDSGEYGLQNLQPLPGDRNVRLWPMVVEKLLNGHSVKLEEVDHFVFTQINHSVIVKVMEVLKQPMTKTTCVMDRYGYTGSGCLPMAFHHAVSEGRVKRGNKVVFVASGAGLAVGSNLFIY